ncbi:MAG: tetratricopeptide repeat protein [Candidatus Glassbacteria bacterium]|nr:tetratricopeptide repeat protein [Candidatus Glassbacteria bacterium]
MPKKRTSIIVLCVLAIGWGVLLDFMVSNKISNGLIETCSDALKWINGNQLATAIIAAVIAGIILKFIRRKPIASPKEKQPPGTTSETDQPERKVSVEEDRKPIWNVSHPRNPYFTGREGLLASLSESLTSGEPTALTQPRAVHGLGGVGKTQLASEFCHTHRDSYEVVWWVRAEEPTTLATDYGELAVKLGLIAEADAKLAERVDATRDWLNSNGEWLLVLDNAGGPGEVKEYIPNSGSGHTIITSRNATWGGTAKPLKVEILAPEKAVKFLLDRTKQKDKKAAAALAEELGCLPLALEQAGSYMEATGQSLAGYHKLFREQCETLLGHPPGCGDYGETVRTTWEISFSKVKEESPAAVELLNLCAFLDPDNISLVDIVKQGAEHLPAALQKAAGKELELDKAVAALKKYSLLERQDNLLSLHRLVQEVVRERLSGDERTAWAGRVCTLMDEIFPFEWNDPDTWAASSALRPHAQAAAAQAGRLQVSLEQAARLYDKIGCHLHRQAVYKQALAAHQKALQLAENELGQDHEKVAIFANNLGVVLKEMGDYPAAKEHYERALRIDEVIYGPDNPNVGIRVGNLGGVLRAMGDLVGAKEHYERALKIHVNVYGPDHPDVATGVSNLGIVLQDTGDLTGAKEHYEWALRIHEAAYGPDHPTVAIDVNNLGDVHREMGDYTAAKEHYERALRIDEAAYGPDHPAVAIGVSNLGAVLGAMGDYAAAKEHYERALRICETTLGPKHPSMATRLNNLAIVLEKMSDYVGAQDYYEQALRIAEAAYSPDHPEVATVLHNLGELLENMGKLEKAKEHYERALRILRQFLGDDHSKTKATAAFLERVNKKLKD